ncbi:MAG: potassium transporter Kup, partial [Verrucomicrobia bacterium]|nr:potassium transporter Kup [Verrucomicrobiota bacterium]
MSSPDPKAAPRWGLVIGALGVVYGDIGTSPLYALRECFTGLHKVPVLKENVIGILSLVFWSLVLVVSIKYLLFVMRAGNEGEGGILSLLTLALGKRVREARGALVVLGVFGASLLYGDGMLTPAVTVLGAVEGLTVATTRFEKWVVPISVCIIVALFSFQRFGTGRVGKVFGPIMLIWFLVLGVLGIRGIFMAPQVLEALNPWCGIKFLLTGGSIGFFVLGAVFLAVTGVESLYADMGHFGLPAIRRAWLLAVFPGLVLNYFGQGALLLSSPDASINPFFKLAPGWALYPLVGLSTVAAVIASQALIAGSFSLTMQAMQLGYVPRLNIQHTSSSEKGQIYIPQVNWALMIACLALILIFQSSARLTSAYGIAIIMTMTITSCVFPFAAWQLWGWPIWKIVLFECCFLSIELAFLSSNALKFLEGGWIPLLIAGVVYLLMSTWKKGRQLVYEQLSRGAIPLDLFMADVKENPPVRVKGTAVFLCGNSDGTPQALLHNLKHNKVLHARTVFLHIATDPKAHVEPEKRLRVVTLENGFYQVTGRYGFMEEPNVQAILAGCAAHGLEFNPMDTTFFLGRETILPVRGKGMPFWREWLFALMSRNAQQATAYF